MDEKTKPRVKSRHEKITEVFVVLLLLFIGWAILIPTGSRAKQNSRRVACQSNLKRIMLSVQQYAQDYDEKYPLVASGPNAGLRKASDNSPFGWVDALFPSGVMMSVRVFQCPSEATDPTKNDPPSFQSEGQSTGLQNQQKSVFSEHDPTQLQFTDYWFNARLAGKRQSELEDAARTIASGEGNDGSDSTDARYHLVEIPKRWRRDENSPLYRHLEGANFAFADGHVKALRAHNWKNALDSSDNSKATFRLKPTAKKSSKKAEFHKK